MKNMILDIFLRHNYDLFEDSGLEAEYKHINTDVTIIGIRDLNDDPFFDDGIADIWYYSYNIESKCIIAYSMDLNEMYYYL